MSDYRATIDWQRRGGDFAYDRYPRGHQWRFRHGVTVEASAAPAYLGTPDRVDPEEALVAAISSCHMLTFLAICSRKRIVVNAYRDNAVGFMESNAQGRLAITRVELSPTIEFDAGPPNEDTLDRIHRLSHQDCFIANSVKTEILIRRLC